MDCLPLPINENGYLLQGYQSIIKEVTTNQLIERGFLTDVEVYSSPNTPDLSNIDINDGDYNMSQASEVMRENIVISNGIDEWIRLGGDKLKTIVFATDIKHCDEVHNYLSSLGYKVGSVHSKMKEDDIEKAYLDFKEDKTNILINVDMATFGFDEPSITCMLFLRPIKSLRLYKQW